MFYFGTSHYKHCRSRTHHALRSMRLCQLTAGYPALGRNKTYLQVGLVPCYPVFRLLLAFFNMVDLPRAPILALGVMHASCAAPELFPPILCVTPGRGESFVEPSMDRKTARSSLRVLGHFFDRPPVVPGFSHRLSAQTSSAWRISPCFAVALPQRTRAAVSGWSFRCSRICSASGP